MHFQAQQPSSSVDSVSSDKYSPTLYPTSLHQQLLSGYVLRNFLKSSTEKKHKNPQNFILLSSNTEEKECQ